MPSKIKEPKQSYKSKMIYDAVLKVWEKEIGRPRKLGLPIIINRNGKIININPQAKWERNDKKEN